MNNNLKVVLGTVAGIMIGSFTVVGANQAIQAIQNTEIKVSLNGQIQEFKDENTGEVQYPITYHNRTYLPLRNVANLFGVKVDYNEKSNTAILNRLDFSEADFNTNNMKVLTNIDLVSYYMNEDGTSLRIVSSINNIDYEKELKGFNGRISAAIGIGYNVFQNNNFERIVFYVINTEGEVYCLKPNNNTFNIVPINGFKVSNIAFNISNNLIVAKKGSADNISWSIGDVIGEQRCTIYGKGKDPTMDNDESNIVIDDFSFYDIF